MGVSGGYGRVEMGGFKWANLDGRIQMGGFRWAGASARALLGTRVAIQCRKDRWADLDGQI